MKFRSVSRVGLALPLLVVGPFLSAQAKPEPTDVIFFETGIGSFKLKNCTGKTTFSFEGTVLVAGLDGTVSVSGNLKKEYENVKEKRVAYFGKGSITVTGKWRGVQWFGENLKGQFDGRGFMQFVGEFDKNMNTGHYWYQSAPDKNIWYTAGMTVTIPPPEFIKNQKPVRSGGGG